MKERVERKEIMRGERNGKERREERERDGDKGLRERERWREERERG